MSTPSSLKVNSVLNITGKNAATAVNNDDDDNDIIDENDCEKIKLILINSRSKYTTSSLWTHSKNHIS